MTEAQSAGGLAAVVEGSGVPLAFESVPLTGVRIDVVARGTASAVTVAQRYVNREKVPVEAVYSFPLEEQAAAYGFETVIGDKRVVGRIEEKEKAFDEYDQAMAAGHGAYLLDQDRPNLFTASIGNLLPGQQAVVTVQYVAPLERNGEQVRLRIPTTVASRYIPAEQLRKMDPAEFDHLNPPTVPGGVPYGLALKVEYQGAGEVLGVECPSHPAKVTMAGGTATVELSGADVQLDRDVVVSFTLAGAGDAAAQVVRDEQGDYVVALDVPAPPAEEREPVEAVFVIDRSGSMSGSSIAQARNALLLALGSLREGDSFNVYGFGSTYHSVFREAMRYDDRTLDQARDAVHTWDADLGGTEILAPLQDVLARPAGELPRRVLLLTDGEVGNEQECIGLVAQHVDRATVFTIGVGYGASDVLVNGISRAGGGHAELVHPNERIEPVVMRQMSRLTASGPCDVKVDWGGLPVDLTAPAVLPPLFPGASLTVYGRVPAGELGGGGTAGGASWSAGPVEVALVATGPDGEVRFPARVDISAAVPDAAVPRLMAREAIRDLEEGRSAAARRGPQQRGRREKHDHAAIAALATRYTLMSSQTSFVAVEVREGAEVDERGAELRRIPVALLEDWHGWGGARYMACGIMADAAMAPFPAAAGPSRKLVMQSTRFDLVDDLSFEAPAAAMPREYLEVAPADHPPEHGDISDAEWGIAGDDTFLYDLIALQRADGSWAWGSFQVGGDPFLAKLLVKQFGLDPALADEVRGTVVALGVLARDYGAQEDQWRSLADKALAWLAVRGVTSPEPGVPLEEWIARRLI